MRTKKEFVTLILCALVSVLLFSANTQAAVKMSNKKNVQQDVTKSMSKDSHVKKIAKSVDVFCWGVITDSYRSALSESRKKFMEQLKKTYNNKLQDKQKSVIAASKTSGYTWDSWNELSIGSVSAKKVKEKYTNLFGTTNPAIALPKVSSKTDTKSYYFDFAKDGSSTVYWLSYENESAGSCKIKSIKKVDADKYIIVKKYKFYNYWGIQESGGKPTQIVTIKIKIKKNSSSSYGYNIIGLTFQ